MCKMAEALEMRGIEKGRKEGMAVGLEEGRVKGQAEGKHSGEDGTLLFIDSGVSFGVL